MIYVLLCSPSGGVMNIFGTYRKRSTALKEAGVADQNERPGLKRSGDIETWNDPTYDLVWRLEAQELK